MGQHIQAAVVESAGSDFVIREPTLGELRPDEILVKIEAAGICHTDLLVAEGAFPTPFPVVLGHEGAGTIEAVGDAAGDFEPGMRVVLSFDYCGKCRNCLAGRPAVCYELLERNFRCQRADGTTALSSGDQAVHSHFLGQSAFATYAVSPARCAIKVDSSIPMTTLAPFGCGIQTGAGAILNTLEPRPGDSVAVFGMGAVGLAAVMAAKISECETVIGIDPVPSRRTLAKELGATHVIDPGEHDPVGAIREITGPGANFSVEASGADGVVSAAMDGLAPGGSCALVGTPTAGTEISLNIEEFMSAARTMRTVLLGDGDPASFIPRLVAYWEGGRLPVERMVSPFQLEQINSAVELATSGEIVKPVLDLTI